MADPELGFQGYYNPAGFIAGNPATYPVPLDPGPPVVYWAGQFWIASGPGTIDVPVVAGDRIYVIGSSRLYGDLTYGDAYYGTEEFGPWAPTEVSWRAWSSTLPPWDRPAPPYSGCVFSDALPGWRIVVEALSLDPDVALRTYGAGNYGSQVYGDTHASTAALVWLDITPDAYSAIVRRGQADGAPVIPVSQLSLDFVDQSADLFPIDVPASWYSPRVGSRIRLGMLAPSLEYVPLFSGRIERITDVHDRPPRTVLVEAYGIVFDLVSDKPNWQRPAETADARIAALMTAGAYDWAFPQLPVIPGPALLADPEPANIQIRQELDRTALSAGWSMDSDTTGVLRFRPWPLAGTSEDPLVVVDCAPGLVAEGVELIGDMAELLNAVQLTNIADDAATAEDMASVSWYGRQSDSLGLPLANLAMAPAAMTTFAAAILARYSRIVNRVGGIEVDISRDLAWFEELVRLDTGRRLTFIRRAFPDHPLTLDAIVTGMEHRIMPGRWATAIFTTTVTPTSA